MPSDVPAEPRPDDPSRRLDEDLEREIEEALGETSLLGVDRARRTKPTEAPPSPAGSGTDREPEPMGRFVAVRLRQAAPNVGGVGAWVEVDAGRASIEREVVVGGGHAGGDVEWVHIGVGAADRVRVRVTWPDGEVGPWQDVDVDAYTELRRGRDPVTVP